MNNSLRLALHAMQLLSDDEQYVLDIWFSSSSRNGFRRAGIGDDEIGPIRKRIDYWAGDFVENVDPIAEEPSPALLTVVRHFRALSDEELEAIAAWFRFEDRKALMDLGVTPEDIGPLRSVPDNTG
jgi:hypothetical protein